MAGIVLSAEVRDFAASASALFVDGAKGAGNGEALTLVDPSTEETIVEFPEATSADVDKAVASAAHALRDEEASLPHITAVLERLHCIYQMCCLSRAQLGDVADQLPRRIGLDCRKPEVVGELVLFEIGEDDGGEGGEE